MGDGDTGRPIHRRYRGDLDQLAAAGVRLTGAGAAASTVGIPGMAIAATAALPRLARRAASGGCQPQ